MDSFGHDMENTVLSPPAGYAALRLPLELKVRPVDRFLGLSQMIPLGAPAATAICYDLGFLRYPTAYPGSAERLSSQSEDAVKRASHLVAISEATKRDILNFYHIQEDRITVSYPGVGDEYVPKGQAHRERVPYFLFVGALKRGKNIPFILKAFARFQSGAKRKYRILLAGGDYWSDPEIQQTIEEFELFKSIKVLGHVSDEELPKLYRGAVALLAPSLWEGFCLPAAEAMKCATPVLYAQSGSLPEIVGDAGLGFLPGDVAAAHEAFVRITGERGLRKTLREKAIRQSGGYTWRKFADTVLTTLSL
jgi:glycosyltransferase involved in cell wall biosynthesis